MSGRTVVATLGLSTLGLTLVATGLGTQPLQPAAASTIDQGKRTYSVADVLKPSKRLTTDKAPSSALARSDRQLLARDDTRPVQVAIKLDYDSVATYAGGISGLPATSPQVTGEPLSEDSSAVDEYEDYVADREAAVVDDLKALVPSIEIDTRLRAVYGGLSAVIPASAAETVLSIPGVVAVQRNDLRQPLTDSSPAFVNAPPVYDALGTTDNAGEGLILGSLDTGVWPEHPSFADQGNLPAPPGEPRECDFGDNPLTPVVDVFQCNNKLIGGTAFLDNYFAVDRPPEPFTSARDSVGHGTHTASTAAGNRLDSAKVFGVERGPVQGLAPGAYVMEYKVCGVQGCNAFDSAAAVQQAILDGVDVINFSISGGVNPYTDPVELAFLDAYAAGVFVAASAGNDGPTAGTANHLGPWVTTVGASTQSRELDSTLTLTGSNGDVLNLDGASITDGVSDHPIVLAERVAGYAGGAPCATPADSGVFEGMIVACQRDGTTARTAKGFNVLQGGAVGMVLYNPSPGDAETDNHWLPTIHLPDGGSPFFPGPTFLGFMNSHASVAASFTAGEKRHGRGDVLAAFSSRGPGGPVLKPDLTAPGIQILAGNTPVGGDPAAGGGPAGELFQAIAGTSMAAPHVAGAALLLQAVHPDWTPGQLKSALMTTAVEDLLDSDGSTSADPFDRGAGRIDIGAAAAAPITFDVSAEDFFAAGSDSESAVNLNLPSIDAPVMPGRIVTTRTATNTTDHRLRLAVETTAPDDASISVVPQQRDLSPGDSATFTVTIESDAPIGEQRFGEIRLVPDTGAALHLPVAFVHRQGDVELTQSCPQGAATHETVTCTVEAANQGFDDQHVDLDTTTSKSLRFTGADGATRFDARHAGRHDVTLAGFAPGVPSVEANGPNPYVPLDQLGVAPIRVGDEQLIQFDGPSFSYDGQSWNSFAVDTNGYVVVGDAGPEDNECCNLPSGPDPAQPNNVLAPLWTDLDGTNADGIYVALLTDGTSEWIVVEHRVKVVGTDVGEVFQTWIGVSDDGSHAQDIGFAYDPNSPPVDPGLDLLVGAENQLGEGDMERSLPKGDLQVMSTDAVPGDTVSYSVDVVGSNAATGEVRTEMSIQGRPGTTIARNELTVTDLAWQSAMYGPGVDNNVLATTVWDDGSGPALYAAGLFLTAGGKQVNRIARWDGTSWQPLPGPSGVGMDAQVLALTVYDGKLVAAGNFTQAGGIAVNGVARWDGERWSPLSGPSGVGMNGTVQALTVYRGELVAGGQFTRAGGVTVNRVARWDGNRWAALGAGVESGTVFSLTVHNDSLILGGNFLQVGGISVNRIARWDGSQWSAMGVGLGTSVTNSVQALTVMNGTLYAGGNFARSGSVTVNNVAAWDGAVWQPLGSGVTGSSATVFALTERAGALVAGGAFTQSAGEAVDNVASWNGTSWSPLSDGSATGVDNSIRTLSVFDGDLVVGGVLSRAGGTAVNRIATWDGTSWSGLAGQDAASTGFNADVVAVTTYKGSIVAGGTFTTAGGATVNGVAVWDGTAWQPLGSGFNGGVRALTVHDGTLIAGGLFTAAGGQPMNRIAQWDGTQWQPLGTGMNGAVDSLATYNGALIAGGRFLTAGSVTTNGLAVWDGTSWSPLGQGLSGQFSPQVWALTVYNGELVAGGVFADAGGVPANNIARWNGTRWATLDSSAGIGVNDRVQALTVYEGTLVAGGGFTQAGGVAADWIAQWDGTTWAPLAGLNGGCCLPFVRALTVIDDSLIAGGVFTNAEHEQVNGIARWDGAHWIGLPRPDGTGVTGGVSLGGGAVAPSVQALLVCPGGVGNEPDTLVVGGSFALTGGVANWGLGFYGPDARQPVSCGPG